MPVLETNTREKRSPTAVWSPTAAAAPAAGTTTWSSSSFSAASWAPSPIALHNQHHHNPIFEEMQFVREQQQQQPPNPPPPWSSASFDPLRLLAEQALATQEFTTTTTTASSCHHEMSSTAAAPVAVPPSLSPKRDASAKKTTRKRPRGVAKKEKSTTPLPVVKQLQPVARSNKNSRHDSSKATHQHQPSSSLPLPGAASTTLPPTKKKQRTRKQKPEQLQMRPSPISPDGISELVPEDPAVSTASAVDSATEATTSTTVDSASAATMDSVTVATVDSATATYRGATVDSATAAVDSAAAADSATADSATAAADLAAAVDSAAAARNVDLATNNSSATALATTTTMSSSDTATSSGHGDFSSSQQQPQQHASSSTVARLTARVVSDDVASKKPHEQQLYYAPGTAVKQFVTKTGRWVTGTIVGPAFATALFCTTYRVRYNSIDDSSSDAQHRHNDSSDDDDTASSCCATVSGDNLDRMVRLAAIRSGTRLAIYWPADDTYYPATVLEVADTSRSKTRQRKAFYVEYDDGEVEWINLWVHEFQLLDDTADRIYYQDGEKEPVAFLRQRTTRTSNNKQNSNQNKNQASVNGGLPPSKQPRGTNAVSADDDDKEHGSTTTIVASKRAAPPSKQPGNKNRNAVPADDDEEVHGGTTTAVASKPGRRPRKKQRVQVLAAKNDHHDHKDDNEEYTAAAVAPRSRKATVFYHDSWEPRTRKRGITPNKNNDDDVGGYDEPGREVTSPATITEQRSRVSHGRHHHRDGEDERSGRVKVVKGDKQSTTATKTEHKASVRGRKSETNAAPSVIRQISPGVSRRRGDVNVLSSASPATAVARTTSSSHRGKKPKHATTKTHSAGTNDDKTIGNDKKCPTVQVGDRVAVYWPGDREYFEGIVTKCRKGRKSHHVEYDDGDHEWLDFTRQTYRILGQQKQSSSSPMPTPSATTYSSTKEANTADISRIRVGTRVSVWWPEDRCYYKGEVTRVQEEAKWRPFFLKYDDGDEEWIDFRQHKFRILSGAAPDDTGEESFLSLSSPPGNKKLCSDLSQVWIGTRLAVWWPAEREFFSGTVSRHRDHKRSFYIEYDDGDREWIDLTEKRFYILSSK